MEQCPGTSLVPTLEEGKKKSVCLPTKKGFEVKKESLKKSKKKDMLEADGKERKKERFMFELAFLIGKWAEEAIGKKC